MSDSLGDNYGNSQTSQYFPSLTTHYLDQKTHQLAHQALLLVLVLPVYKDMNGLISKRKAKTR